MFNEIQGLKDVANRLKREADYVVEIGSNEDGWHWRKWNSGYAECWISWKGTVSNYTSTAGMGACTYAFIKFWDLPFAFIERYSKTATAQVGSGYGIVSSGGLNDTLDKVCLHWVSNTTGASTVNIHIKGKWK
mgnify:CR=1 FL=1